MRDGSDVIKCYRCGERKPAEEFAWRRRARDQCDSFCRPCRAAYKREHYLANRERYIRRANTRQERLRDERQRWLLDFFKSHPCVSCGEADPLVLEFDHIGGEKRFTIGMALVNHSWQAILDEIAKCEVVCANCHRRRTATRRGSIRHRLLTDSEAGGGN